jgi:ABC-type transport system involved in cytochrome c biogenesis permease subunit
MSASLAIDPDEVDRTDHGLPPVVVQLLRPIASLKLTVGLFAAAIFIILAGTLAQVDADIWQVINEYFRTAIAWIPLQIFFPPSFFPGMPKISGGFYFPGGWLIGAVMSLNLLAAHLIRFRVQASGGRLVSGLIVLLAGMVLTYAVIQSGFNKDGVQEDHWLSYRVVWIVYQASLFCALTGAAAGWYMTAPSRKTTRWLLAGATVVLGSGIAALFFAGLLNQPGDASMRILWQLTKSGAAAAALLAGCILVFRKRAGVVLLHGGVGLMMFGELLVGMSAVEGQMHLKEGEVVNYVQDIRTVELAVVDPSDSQKDRVTVIPRSVLLAAEASKQPIDNKDLPFRVQVDKFLQNSDVRRVRPMDEKNPATAGLGKEWIADPVKAGTGVDTSSKVDMTAAYVTLLPKTGDTPLGTYLTGILFSSSGSADTVDVDGKPYEISLRFKRMYKPYSVKLVDVRKDDYVGTDTPRNYSSDVQLVDPERHVDRPVHIWMNNPLRFAGETFYQSGYFKDPSTGVEQTTLQVVSNTSWMIPYVSCMIVALGMLTHFFITLLRFLNRADRVSGAPIEVSVAKNLPEGVARPKAIEPVIETAEAPVWIAYGIPAVALAIGLAVIAVGLTPRKPKDGGLDLSRFGEIPVISQGRAKPLDTLARHSLLATASRETFKDANDKTQPAIRWLMDLLTDREAVLGHRTFQIPNLEVQQLLGLEPREHFRYSPTEFLPKLKELTEEAEAARAKPAEQLSVKERKILELERKLGILDLLFQSFTMPPIRTDADHLAQDLLGAIQSQQRLLKRSTPPPLGIPPMKSAMETPEDQRSPLDSAEWETYANAAVKDIIKSQFKSETRNPAYEKFEAILAAYREKDAKSFNAAIDDYLAYLKAGDFPGLDLPKSEFEASFNRFAPFFLSRWLYVLAFVLAVFGWLTLPKTFTRAAVWLTMLILVLHTYALVGRIYISGRPPVTNLYSSAVFIGWGGAVLALILERIFRNGLGVVVATVAGFLSLGVAEHLASDGTDTFAVLQAVLDTQFWLSTHVVCITLGYSTTYLAGLLGVLFVGLGVCTPLLNAKLSRDLVRMIYGTLCFSIFFSFVGTVLGGLWADDSWGRFWGWDPKENGALIIVLWNALCLHARWGGMVKDRGLALLAVAGNIAVSWSWFGVNELGVGLHSYGFREGLLMWLGVFVLSQLAIIGLGSIPRQYWLSRKSAD